jgi:hypothetical protein
MFLWLEAPSDDIAERLLEHGLIVSPGTFFGPAGEGYFRLALVPTRRSAGARPRSSRRSVNVEPRVIAALDRGEVRVAEPSTATGA